MYLLYIGALPNAGVLQEHSGLPCLQVCNALSMLIHMNVYVALYHFCCLHDFPFNSHLNSEAALNGELADTSCKAAEF